MSERELRAEPRSRRSSTRITQWAVLALLLGLAVVFGARLLDQDGPALATLIFQSDPNSPEPTPTFTDTPLPTNTPVATSTPVPTTGPGTPTPLPPTNTPLPTDTPPGAATPAATPTWTPLPPPEPTPTPPEEQQPPFVSPITPPTPTPVLGVAPPPVPPPPAAPTPPTIEAGAPVTDSEEIVLLVRPLDRRPAVEGAARRLDPALFIDNLVVAAGYVWACFGVLALVAGLIGGALLLRRSRSGRTSPPAPAPRPITPPPAPPSTPRAAPPPVRRDPVPPPPSRFAARHNTADLDDRDRPDA